MVETLERAKLAYAAKIASVEREYVSRGELPMIIYVPSLLALRYVSDVVETVGEVLVEFRIRERAYFKPELFTKKGVYSRAVSHKPYIYIYEGLKSRRVV